jgi:hypothetical protein
MVNNTVQTDLLLAEFPKADIGVNCNIDPRGI